jgi:hypothetical protein
MKMRDFLNNLFRAPLVGLFFALPISAPAAQLFDPPLKEIELPAQRDFGEIICTIYPDVIIREIDTETPDPGKIMVLPRGRQDSSPACGRDTPAAGIEMPKRGVSFLGRKGIFMVLDATDPSSAGYFTIFDIRNGHRLFGDGDYGPDWIFTMNAVAEKLYMTYRRGINAPCSLLLDSAQCWAQLLREGDIPRRAFAGPPAIKLCAKSYRADPATARDTVFGGDPTLITYPVGLTLDSFGNNIMRVLGPMQCLPQP